ncbi:replicative DNA helicase [Veillonella sp.]|uniref:replicative DNA helicase n=1 Tax=Veillonella sp. TaxID=1926307 RepID=UPI00257E7D3F|nr:replicative DNA helicase [Veillonella sp.]MBS4892040.1 replicative DNA helicase [Veillonella sp.]
MDVRIPPHNLDAEKAVLGALLTNGSNSGAVVDTVTSILKSEDFYRDAHRIIYDAILEIVHANKTADFITVGEELDRRKRLDAVGGLAYITSLANESVSYNVEEHAKIISEKAQLRRLIDAGNKIVGMTYAGEDEPTTILNKAEQMVLDVSGQTQSESSFAPISEIVLSNLDKLNALQQHDGAITGVPTGFKDVDHVFNGLQKSDLILVAARPAMGKTAFTLNIAQNVTMLYDKTVAFFSLEMGKEQLVARILSSVAGVSSEKLRRAYNMDPTDWEKVIAAADRMSKAKLFIDDTPGLTVQDMRSKLRRLKVEHGLDLVIVDYIQLMQGRNSGKGSENRQQEVSEISRNLKLIAREFNVPLIALSQLSRSVESRPDKRPVLSDLRESGSLEQDADIVIFLYRDKYYDENSEKGDNAEVLIRKHRNGSVGTVELQFIGELTQFRDVEFRDMGPEP